MIAADCRGRIFFGSYEIETWFRCWCGILIFIVNCVKYNYIVMITSPKTSHCDSSKFSSRQTALRLMISYSHCRINKNSTFYHVFLSSYQLIFFWITVSEGWIFWQFCGWPDQWDQFSHNTSLRVSYRRRDNCLFYIDLDAGTNGKAGNKNHPQEYPNTLLNHR